ncbi:MAG: hypothetical protein K0S21_2350 [Rhizobiaceae bacterium]|jgi:hypothetical protein|nr:hypothetical protein [Rhizobiaceae bacterium]
MRWVGKDWKPLAPGLAAALDVEGKNARTIEPRGHRCS